MHQLCIDDGDTVQGAPGKGVIVTLADRNSRYLVAQLCRDKKTDTVEKAIIAAIKEEPVETMSFDNGSEFAAYHTVQKPLETTIYFADPHSPWQRGSKENLNGLLRFFFPKGCNLLDISGEYLAFVHDLINKRPRKYPGWLSLHDIFIAKCCS